MGIKVLNDDDALELFKKTLPSAAASFLQIEMTASAARARALAALRSGRSPRGGPLAAHPGIDLIELALNGKQMGFEKVIAMIDEMVANLHKEQEADDSLKTYCDKEFDESDDKKKELELSISDSEAALEEPQGAIKTLKDE